MLSILGSPAFSAARDSDYKCYYNQGSCTVIRKNLRYTVSCDSVKKSKKQVLADLEKGICVPVNQYSEYYDMQFSQYPDMNRGNDGYTVPVNYTQKY